MAAKKPKLLCPNGHKLPHVLNNGAQCTSVICAVENMGNSLAKAKQEDGDEDKEVAIVLEKARRQEAVAVARERLRKKLVPRPEKTDTKTAEEWSDERIQLLLPDAVAEIEFNLRFGDDAQRERAAQRIMDANGRGRRDAPQAGGQTIILNMQGGLPWATAKEVVINGNTTIATGKAPSGQAEAVRKHLPEELRRSVDADSGRRPAASGTGGESDAAGVHQGPDTD